MNDRTTPYITQVRPEIQSNGGNSYLAKTERLNPCLIFYAIQSLRLYKKVEFLKLQTKTKNCRDHYTLVLDFRNLDFR